VAVRTEGALYIFVVNVNVNSDGLNVNVNRLENDNVWNAENRHRVVVPQLLNFSFVYFEGVLFSKPFFQPPSMRPTSFKFSDKVAYFMSVKHLFSQASWRKNLRLSSFIIAKDN
jgi:hypothetical protein